MPRILPVSDLKSYNEVLKQCDNGTPVYLTKNGRGKYVVQRLEDYEKLLSTVHMLSELNKGMASLRKEDSLSIEEAFAGLED